MRSRQLNLAVGILLLTCLVNTATAQPAADDKPHLVDPNQYLEERVIIPLRLWDKNAERYVDDWWESKPHRFLITERKVLQVPLAVDKEYRPFSIALVLDTSDSMRESLPAVRQAGRRLFNRLKPTDQVSLISFKDDVAIGTDLTNDRRVMNRRLAGLHSSGFTSLHDGIDTALDVLEHQPDPRALVVLTDGMDNRSHRYREEVLERANRARIPLFFIYHKVLPEAFQHLTEAAAYTGGRVFEARNDEDLIRIFGAIADGLRMTNLLAYRSSYSRNDEGWRDVEVGHKTPQIEVDTWKNGYFPNKKIDLSPLMGLRFPLTIPPPTESYVEEPFPRHICPTGFTGPLPQHCPGELTARLFPDQPTRMEIQGWIDLAHDMGPMLHPTKYGDGSPIPDDPRDGEFQDWRYQREYAGPVPIWITLPRPDRLPASTNEIWDRLLTSGATFRSMGMIEEPDGTWRPDHLQTVLSPVPGFAATSGGTLDMPAFDLWWPDGNIAGGLRRSFTSWLFRMSPDYRIWVRDRYEEATSNAIHREYKASLARLPQPVPERLKDQLATYVESNVRSARRVGWNRILDGELLPSAHLLVPRRDIPAVEWFNDGDRLLLTRMMESMPISPESLKTAWLLPARRAWSDLRTFLAPISHRSLTIGLPFHDRESGQIYLQRMLMPWCDADQLPDCVQFPPPRPEGLELVAELVARPDLESELGSGAYRCSGRCTSTETDYSDDPDSMPPRRRLAWQALSREQERITAIRDELGKTKGAWLIREKQFLEEAMDAMENLQVSVFVRLHKSGGEGTGLILRRNNDSAPWATPLKPVGMVIEIDDLSSTTDLASLARDNGFRPESPEIASALLATRINRTTLANLRNLAGDGDDAICRPGEDFASIRLLFQDDLIENLRPGRIRLLNGSKVLLMNLVAGPLDRIRASLLEACEPAEPENAP